VDPSTPQTDSPSKIRVANIPEKAVEKASKSLRKNVSPDDDDSEILDNLNVVWLKVHEALELDPGLKEDLASEEEYRANVTREGEKNFIDSLRAMAANSDTQGNKAWKELFQNGTLFSLGPSILILFSVQMSF
jgi:hypothetical protein